MKSLTCKEIEWKTFKPHDFPCFVCKQKYADYLLKYTSNIVTANLPVCEDCKEISIEEFEKQVFGKEI